MNKTNLFVLCNEEFQNFKLKSVKFMLQVNTHLFIKYYEN
jgi:hypothetical protein